MSQEVIGVVGGGIIGLATAWRLQRARPGARVVVFEKESSVGQHQSTHNSGVLHAGVYYAPGSFKARLAVQGIRQMIAFCQEHGIVHDICGKIVAAVTDDEVPRLRELEKRGTANGLAGLEWMSPERAREIEPNVNCVAALRVPEEGIVDYGAVCDTLSRLVVAGGGDVHLGSAVTRLHRERDGWTVETSTGDVRVDYLVTCAGLHADRIARLAGEATDIRIVPFRGEYYRLRADRSGLVRHLIYPVPDPRFPFLGVHFTRMIGGGVECGPNAVLALAREGYSRRTARLTDILEVLRFGGVWRFLARYPRMSANELWRSFHKPAFCASLQRLVPAVQITDLEPGGAGVRAQAMGRDGSLMQDFVLRPGTRALHVLNAPSPGATASLAIGEQIAGHVTAAMS